MCSIFALGDECTSFLGLFLEPRNHALRYEVKQVLGPIDYEDASELSEIQSPATGDPVGWW
jgi:hypothetical protein